MPLPTCTVVLLKVYTILGAFSGHCEISRSPVVLSAQLRMSLRVEGWRRMVAVYSVQQRLAIVLLGHGGQQLLPGARGHQLHPAPHVIHYIITNMELSSLF